MLQVICTVFFIYLIMYLAVLLFSFIDVQYYNFWDLHFCYCVLVQLLAPKVMNLMQEKHVMIKSVHLPNKQSQEQSIKTSVNLLHELVQHVISFQTSQNNYLLKHHTNNCTF